MEWVIFAACPLRPSGPLAATFAAQRDILTGADANERRNLIREPTLKSECVFFWERVLVGFRPTRRFDFDVKTK